MPGIPSWPSNREREPTASAAVNFFPKRVATSSGLGARSSCFPLRVLCCFDYAKRLTCDVRRVTPDASPSLSLPESPEPACSEAAAPPAAACSAAGSCSSSIRARLSSLRLPSATRLPLPPSRSILFDGEPTTTTLGSGSVDRILLEAAYSGYSGPSNSSSVARWARARAALSLAAFGSSTERDIAPLASIDSRANAGAPTLPNGDSWPNAVPPLSLPLVLDMPAVPRPAFRETARRPFLSLLTFPSSILV